MALLGYLSKRIALGLATLLAIMTLSYVLMRLAPGDPTRSQMIGENTADSKGVNADRKLGGNTAIRKKLYLDKPIHIGFLHWMRQLLTEGSLGESAAVDKGRPVGEMIIERLPVTIKLNLMALVVTYLFAIPIGIYSAIRPDSAADRLISFVLFFLYSLPVFWVALMLQAGVCVGGWLPVFPLKGVWSGNITGLGSGTIIRDALTHYILPVICLSYAGFAGLSRYARAGMLEVINQDFIRTARAKGLPETTVIFKHALRNAMIILVTLFAGLLPGLVAGSIIVEHVFSIPGMGDLSMLALSSRDYPLLMALFGFAGTLTLAGILVSDLLYVAVDPRITFDSRK